MTAPTDALRHQIAHACHPVKIVGRGTVSRSKLEMADAVLALPAIADAVALADLCAPLTIGQVARALQHASRRFAMPEHIGLLTDDEKAIASWEDK